MRRRGWTMWAGLLGLAGVIGGAAPTPVKQSGIWRPPSGLRQEPIWPGAAPDMAAAGRSAEHSETSVNPRRFAGRPVTYTAAEPMATKGDPVRAQAYAAAWDNSPALRRIHVRLSVVIGLGMLAYAVLRIVIIYTASSIAEAVWAATAGGAAALDMGEVGVLRPGARANLHVLDAPSAAHLAYRPGVPLTHAVWRAGVRAR